MAKFTFNIQNIKYLRLNLVALLVCWYFELRTLRRFGEFHIGVGRNCYLFGQFHEVERVFTPGPALICNGHLLYSILLCLFMLWWMKKIYEVQFLYKNIVYRIIAVVILLSFLLDIILIGQGLKYLCRSIISSPECSSEVFFNIDFRTFKPKYMEGWGFHIVANSCMETQFKAFISWLAYIIIEIGRYWLLQPKDKEAEVNANHDILNETYNNHTKSKAKIISIK